MWCLIGLLVFQSNACDMPCVLCCAMCHAQGREYPGNPLKSRNEVLARCVGSEVWLLCWADRLSNISVCLSCVVVCVCEFASVCFSLAAAVLCVAADHRCYNEDEVHLIRITDSCPCTQVREVDGTGAEQL